MNKIDVSFEKLTLNKRISSMISLDFRRMFTMGFFYIVAAVSFFMPVLILVMTTMMDGSVTVDPNTGKETVIEGFDNVWQIIGSVSSMQSDGSMSMDITSMCNINLIFFAASVLVCKFISDDFRSGYSKNLFAVRSAKGDYIVSKTVICFLCGALMLILFFAGSIIGGVISALPFEMTGFNISGLVMSMLSKIMLMGVFVAIYVVMAMIAKQKLWLSILLSLICGMFLFAVIPIITPLDSTFINVIFTCIGTLIFSVGLGIVSRTILNKKDIL